MIVLLNEIVAAPNHLVLVLDDYHLITAPAIRRAIAFLLDHLPASMHLVLISRADPPLPLARLRAHGQLVEIRTDDLRFTPYEAATFLNRIMDLKLSADQVAALKSRTEGWIAGLQMAALSMRGREDIHSFVSAFAGSHRYILDYLAEEVLNRQPACIQTFLLLTCLLNRLSAPLCDAVLARESGHSQTMLEYLERANLFITSLDDERRWYRYHHLFAEVLRHRLAQTQPDRARDLHHRASEWHAERIHGRSHSARAGRPRGRTGGEFDRARRDHAAGAGRGGDTANVAGRAPRRHRAGASRSRHCLCVDARTQGRDWGA